MNNNMEFDPWVTEPAFELDRIKNGVDEPEREHVLNQYVGFLIGKEKCSWSDLVITISQWNLLNRPPFDQLELMVKLEDCWNRWADPWQIEPE